MVFQHEDDEFPEPPRLRRLRWLVIALTVVLMLGVLTIAATVVIRLGLGIGEATGPIAAEAFELPAGEVVAVGRGAGTVLFVLRGPDGDERVLAFDERTGEPAGRSDIRRTHQGPGQVEPAG